MLVPTQLNTKYLKGVIYLTWNDQPGIWMLSLADHLTLKFGSHKNFLYNPVEDKEVCLTRQLKSFCLDENEFLEGLSFVETDYSQRFKGPPWVWDNFWWTNSL